MLDPGTILGGRYEVISKIGTGGMADVYKGKDHKLNRFIAIKVLKSEYSSNKNFVSKFKVEAQSAAGLMHPNIVNVYDVGDEDGMYYFVMELVEGITLKSYIEKKIRLSIEEAISIAIQVSMGIEAAHNNGIIHRDIKPQNIIISKDGKVKVADFGIARAATSDTITSHAMGSVHYTSPEQARGGYSDAKSDIYSIGITIFEMVTGRVPYDGETTVSIAIKHIQEEMPTPRIYVPDIPISVEQIIMKCTQKNPDRRYASVTELIADLKKSLISPNEDFVKIYDAFSNEGTKIISRDEREEIKSINAPYAYQEMQSKANGAQDDYGQDVYGRQDDYDQSAYGRQDVYGRRDAYDNGISVMPMGNIRRSRDVSSHTERSEDYRREKVSTGRSRYDGKPARNSQKRSGSSRNYKRDYYDDRRADEDGDPRMEKAVTVFMIAAAVVIAIIAIIVVIRTLGLGGSGSDMVTVPNVVGLDLNEAATALEEAGLTAKASYAQSAEYDKDIVSSQDPKAGTRVEKDSVLTLVISSGRIEASEDGDDKTGTAAQTAVPDVVGKSEAEARVLIENEGFVMVKETAESSTVEKGNVISQSPLGATMAANGSSITVTISEGKSVEETEVPDLVGKTEEAAKILLDEAGLTCSTVTEEHNESVDAGLVISQSYAAGSKVDKGTVVDFKISLGPSGYKCNVSINAPADYLAGSEAIIVLTDVAGSQLASVSTSSFPYNLTKDGIQGSNSGLLTVTYQKMDGSWDTTTPVSVTFTQEQ